MSYMDVVKEQEELLNSCTSKRNAKKSNHIDYEEMQKTIQEQAELLEHFSKSPVRSAPRLGQDQDTSRQYTLSPSPSDLDRTATTATTRTSYTTPGAPPALELPLGNDPDSQEVDVDSIPPNRLQIERRLSSGVTSGRHSFRRFDSHSSFEDSLVGAWNVRGAPPPQPHPSDQLSQGSFPTQVLRRPPSEDQSSITRTVFSNGHFSVFQPEAEVVKEEPSSLPLPSTHPAHLTMTQPPESDPPTPTHQPPPTEQKSTFTYFLGGLCFVATVSLVLLLLFTFVVDVGLPFYQGRSDESRPTSTDPPMRPSPTSSPTSAQDTLQDIPGLPQILVDLVLPTYTWDAIQNDPESPQSLAYEWIIEDVERHPERLMPQIYQRFALMTVFYATGGNTWDLAQGWQDHDLDECDWVTSVGEDKFLPSPFRLYVPSTCMFESLDLSENGLQGSLPPELSLLTNLRYINFQRNDIKKAPSNHCLPTELGLLMNLEHLDFLDTFDSLSCGTIPSEIGQLTVMKNLQLEQNHFSGSLPTELGLLTNLEELNLEQNHVSGTLPTVLASLLKENLSILNLDGNELSGTIPSDFDHALRERAVSDAEDLSEMIIRLGGIKQALTGTIPSAMCRLRTRLYFTCDQSAEEGLCGCDSCKCTDEGNPDDVLFSAP